MAWNYSLVGLLCLGLSCLTGMLQAEESPSAVSAVMRLLQSGRVPESRIGAIVEQIARRGNDHDLAYLFGQCLDEDAYGDELLLHTLELLEEAASDRGVIPAGDLGGLVELMSQEGNAGSATQSVAVRLAGLWKVETAVDRLCELVRSGDLEERQRLATLGALAAIGGEAARSTIQQLSGSDQPMPLRLQAIASLVGLDVDDAARRAALVLTDLSSPDDPAPLMAAFLERQGGSDRLAAALEASPPSADVAKLAMRAMYAVGRSDPRLSSVLGHAAGIDANPTPPTPEEVQQLVARVETEGEAVQGEEVFRRADLSCMKCHAVSRGGGQIGPDLSAVGATSPVEYLLNSIYDPDQQIKEAFQTRVVMTNEGLVIHGIIVDSSEERLVLKDAAGKQVTIPTSDIEASLAGQSLMPKGLTRFMTQDEVLDLVKFLSLLGRPETPYAIRTTPRMQRWRVVQEAGQQFAEGILNADDLRSQLDEPSKAIPLYSRTGGDLPLAEAVARSGEMVVHVVGEFEVTEAGELGVRLNDAQGVTMWVDDQPTDAAEAIVPMERGRHLVLLRIDTQERTSDTLQLELFRVTGSRAEFAVIDGA